MTASLIVSCAISILSILICFLSRHYNLKTQKYAAKLAEAELAEAESAELVETKLTELAKYRLMEKELLRQRQSVRASIEKRNQRNNKT